MTDLTTEIRAYLDSPDGEPCCRRLLRECIPALEKGDGYEAANGLIVEHLADCQVELNILQHGIFSIIRQIRQSSVMGDDAQAVADELEALIGEGDGE